MQRILWLGAACSVLIGLAVVSITLSRSNQHTVPSARHTSYTLQQILDRALPLCRALAPEAGDMTVSVDRQASYLIHAFWNVTATDKMHRDIVTLRWNDDTGEIYLASHLETRYESRASRPLNGQQVLASAKKWMHVLGFAGLASHWRLTKPPRRIHDVWSMVWQAEGHEAYIGVHAYTGSLVWTQNRQVADAPASSLASSGHERSVAGVDTTAVPL